MDAVPVTLRLRGTFIDFYPEMKRALGNRRSASEPACTDRAPKSGYMEQYLFDLIAQTRRMTQVHLPIKQFHGSDGDDTYELGLDHSTDVSTESPTVTAMSSNPDSEDEALASNGCPMWSMQEFADSPCSITTMMLCDLPCRASEDEIKGTLATLGFAGTYDFLHVPVKQRGRRNKGNLGYAFVNFCSAEYASRFATVFANIRFPAIKSTKLSYAKPAAVQGREANVKMHSAKKWFQRQQRKSLAEPI